MRVTVGIDPGASGAIAFVADGQLVDVIDMPTDEVKVSGGVRNRVSPARLAKVMEGARGCHVYIELVGAMPVRRDGRATQGTASAFTFGKAAGLVEMAAAVYGSGYTLVTPAEWKRVLRVPADKDGAARRAAQLFPASVALFYGPRGGALDGRAEAALIALFGEQSRAP